MGTTGIIGVYRKRPRVHEHRALAELRLLPENELKQSDISQSPGRVSDFNSLGGCTVTAPALKGQPHHTIVVAIFIFRYLYINPIYPIIPVYSP